MDKAFLYDLLGSHGVSGSEEVIEKKIYDHMQGKADVVTVDELGCVTACLNPDSSFKVMMAGHADEIGLMITRVTGEGFLQVTNIGGLYYHCYPGHQVAVRTKKGIIYGAVVNNRSIEKNNSLSSSDLLIDIGAKDKEDALNYVSLGDTITIDSGVRELLNNKISARAMDDRTGVFIVMEAVRRAKEKGAKVGVYGVATTGEETTGNGAYFTGSRIRPNIAIAVDVTYATDYAGTDSAETGDVSVGGGPVICNNPSIHKKVNEALYEAAKRAGIKVQTEACNGRTGTDGDTIHRTGMGVPFALVSIPLRYMHSPDEVGSLDDIEGCIEVLAEFLAAMDESFNLLPF